MGERLLPRSGKERGAPPLLLLPRERRQDGKGGQGGAGESEGAPPKQGPSGHAALPAGRAQQEAHELRWKRLRLHPGGSLARAPGGALLRYGRHGNGAGQGVRERQR